MRLFSTSILLVFSFFPASALTAQTQASAPAHPLSPVAQLQPDTAERNLIQELRAAKVQSMAKFMADHSCPIELTADRRSQTAVLYASDRSSNHDQHQLLQIRIGDSKLNDAPKTVAAVDLLLHGYLAGTRITPVAYSSANQQATETVHLSADAGTGPIDINIRPNKLAIVERVELTRILYADGSVWEPSAASTCVASPSPLLLVQASVR